MAVSERPSAHAIDRLRGRGHSRRASNGRHPRALRERVQSRQQPRLHLECTAVGSGSAETFGDAVLVESHHENVTSEAEYALFASKAAAVPYVDEKYSSLQANV